MGTIVLLDLMGGVALLLWGLHMVQSGILRAFGADLRHFLSKAFGNRFSALAAGLGLTALLQSSTATGLMTASFAAEGLVALVPALAIMLGANVGTTLIVQLLSFNVTAAAPVLFVIGLVSFRSGAAHPAERRRARLHRPRADAARAAHPARYFGTGGKRTQRPRAAQRHRRRSSPVRHHRGGAHLGRAFQRRDRVADHVAGIFALRSPASALRSCLERISGSAINPVLEGGQAATLPATGCPSGICSIAPSASSWSLPFLQPITDAFRSFEPNMAKMAAEFHIAFNVALAARHSSDCWILWRGCLSILPARRPRTDPSAPRYLDESALETPSLALADAARETLHMGDIVEIMLRQTMTALMTDDRALAAKSREWTIRSTGLMKRSSCM